MFCNWDMVLNREYFCDGDGRTRNLCVRYRTYLFGAIEGKCLFPLKCSELDLHVNRAQHAALLCIRQGGTCRRKDAGSFVMTQMLQVSTGNYCSRNLCHIPCNFLSWGLHFRQLFHEASVYLLFVQFQIE